MPQLIVAKVKPEELTEEIFRKEYLLKNKPVVIEGGIKHWPAIEKWKNLNYLIEKIGDATVEVDYAKDTFFTYYSTKTREGTFKEIITKNFLEPLERKKNASTEEEINNPENNPLNFYIQQISIPHKLPALLDDLSTLPVLKNETNYLCNVWAGSGHMKGGCHFDYPPNLLCMINGSKRLFLGHPTPYRAYYPEFKGANTTRVDTFCFTDSSFKNPNQETVTEHSQKYPLFDKDTTRAEITLNEGDVLYLPPFYWHQVISSKEDSHLNIAINFWFIKPSNIATIISRNPSLWEYAFSSAIKLIPGIIRPFKRNHPWVWGTIRAGFFLGITHLIASRFSNTYNQQLSKAVENVDKKLNLSQNFNRITNNFSKKK